MHNFRHISRQTKLFFILFWMVVIGIGVAIFLFPLQRTSAQISLVGGPITQVICGCDNNPNWAYIQVGPPNAGEFVVRDPQIYREGSPNSVGQLVLGRVGEPRECVIGSVTYVGREMIDIEPNKTGTSKATPLCSPGGAPSSSLPSSPPAAGQCSTVSSGPCSVENLRSVFSGTQCSAETMSRICYRESGGRAGLPSGVDRLRYEPGNPAFSYGLFQINLTANPISCPDGRFLNCPTAFNPPSNPSERFDLIVNGKNLGSVRSGAGFGYTIKDQNLFNQCVAAAKDPACNAATARRLCQAAGTQPWRCLATGCIGCSVE